MNDAERWLRVYRATLDTNIFLRSLIRKGNLSDRILGLWRGGQFVLVLSWTIIEEIRAVLSRDSLRREYNYPQQAVDGLVSLLIERAIVIDTPLSLGLCRDASDEKFVDCAIVGRVQFLVSYDADLVGMSD